MADIDLPPELQQLQPLADALEIHWSNHYFPPNYPDAKWCVVGKSGHAGRVGMTVEEASAHLIRAAAHRIQDLRAAMAEHHLILQSASADLKERLGKL